jgi:hypothetical protein
MVDVTLVAYFFLMKNKRNIRNFLPSKSYTINTTIEKDCCVQMEKPQPPVVPIWYCSLIRHFRKRMLDVSNVILHHEVVACNYPHIP